MRISDWSSDVCSSDLAEVGCGTTDTDVHSGGDDRSRPMRDAVDGSDDRLRISCQAPDPGLSALLCRVQRSFIEMLHLMNVVARGKRLVTHTADRTSTRLNSSH